MYLSKDDILKADDLPTRDVTVDEWGGVVRVRGLTGTERDRFEFALAAAQNDPSKVEVRAQIVGRCIVDGDGKRLFTDNDIARLGAKSGAALDRLFDVVRELSGMTEDATAEAVEHFGGAPGDGSPSA